MKRILKMGLIALFAGALFASVGNAGTTKSSTFTEINEHYQAVWEALIDDNVKGVKKHAKAIERAAAGLSADFSAGRAGITADKQEVVKKALPEIVAAAKTLQTASGIDASREAFYALSKPLVRYRAAVPDPGNVVVYCSMANKSWLQPDAAIGNPYYGKSMLRCGDVVAR